MSFIEIYLIGLAVILGFNTVLWIVSLIVRDSSIIDPFWGETGAAGDVDISAADFPDAGRDTIERISSALHHPDYPGAAAGDPVDFRRTRGTAIFDTSGAGHGNTDAGFGGIAVQLFLYRSAQSTRLAQFCDIPATPRR